MTRAESLLKSSGPILSSELARQLASYEGISVNTASQRISRETSIKKIGGFFRYQQSLVYLPDQAKQGLVYPVLEGLMKQNGVKYWNALSAVIGNGGSISREFLECYTSFPIIPITSHKTFDEVMRRFVDENILIYDKVGYSLGPNFHPKLNKPGVTRGIEFIKQNVLDHFRDQQRNTGMVSYETAELMGEYGGFRWAFKGLCPIMGLRRGQTMGFVLGDVLLGRPINLKDVLFFTTKLDIINSYQNAPKLIPYLIVDNLSPEAMRHLKERGIVIGFINELFGERYATLLKQLIEVLKKAGDSLNGEHPDRYLDLLNELRKYNKGLLNNMRGTLFEYMVGHIHAKENASIEMGREVFVIGAKHEMDVKAEYTKKVVFAECKSYKLPVDRGMVNVWITQKVPAFFKWFNEQDAYNGRKPEFEYWSTSGYDDDALEKLTEFAKLGKHTVRIYGPKEIKQIVAETNDKKMREAVENFYLKPIV